MMPLEPIDNRDASSAEAASVSIALTSEPHAAWPAVRRALPAWGASWVAHAVLIAVIAVVQVPGSQQRIAQVIRLVPQDAPQPVVIEPPDVRNLEIGPESGGGELSQWATVPPPTVSMRLEPRQWQIPEPLFSVPAEAQRSLTAATGEDFFRRFKTKGLAGVGTSSAAPAIDRLTREILLSLEERPTLVVWILDQSASLIPQRAEIQQRLDRIYRELGAVQASGDGRKRDQQPLLSSLIAFGSGVQLCLAKPTSDAAELQDAVARIARDDSGTERVFGAVLFAAQHFRKFRRSRRELAEPLRNVMLVVMTDEAGDDQVLLEEALQACSNVAIPVFVIGVPAPFGQRETLVKWIDPDPNYDQTPRWGAVSQGPETVAAERIRIGSEFDPELQVPIDSGFGSFALTRLAYETGGIYFAVHADRERLQTANRHQVQAFSSHLQAFFDADVMARYQPDYVSVRAYERILQRNPARQALVSAATASWISPLTDPQVRFVFRSEAQLAADLTEAQKAAAVRLPRLQDLYRRLQKGESARARELEPRWQAGFDLAMGQVLAELVRNESYNAMLAHAKRGLTFADPRHNTWTLQPAGKIEIDSELQRLSQKAGDYLDRVCQQHPGTPWSFLAQQQRQRPLGWEWRESRTLLPEDREQMARQRAAQMPRDEQPQRLPRKPTRNMPRL